MRIVLIFTFVVVSFFGFGQTKDDTYYFNNAARAYVKNTDSVCIYLKDGLKKYPESQRLKALAQKAQCAIGEPQKQYPGIPPKPKDSDNDGVSDSQDNCPDVYGEKSNKGCPGGGGNPQPPGLSDSDGDGVNDAQDNCPDEKGLKSNSGCPKSQPQPQGMKDKDNDGIPDIEDNCPTQRGSRSNNGCPEEPPAGPTSVEVNLRRGSGNTITWSRDLVNSAEEIRITFKEEKSGKVWVNNINVSGQHSYVYSPGDARAGDVATTVTLNIKLKKGYKLQGSKILANQYFDCSGSE